MPMHYRPKVTYPESISKSKKWKHPRLFFSRADIPQLKRKIDNLSASTGNDFYALAESDLETPPPDISEYAGGRKGRDRSGQFKGRMYRLSFLYQISGDRRFLDRAFAEIEAATHMPWVSHAFPPYSPKIAVRYADLALGERAHGLGVAYDWLYEGLTEQQRAMIRELAITKVFDSHYLAGQKRGEWSCRENMNWNGVVNGGAGILALSMLGEIDEANRSLEIVRWLLPRMVRHIGQDGGWDEGISYAVYGLSNAGAYILAMKNVLGTDDGLIDCYKNLGYFMEMIQWYDHDGSKRSFRFSDSTSRGVSILPELLRMFPRNKDYLHAYDHDMAMRKRKKHAEQSAKGLKRRHFGITRILYRPDVPEDPTPLSQPRYKHFRDTGLFCYRGEKLHTLYLGRDTAANHAHYDMGSFELVFNRSLLITELNYGDTRSIQHNCLQVNKQEQAFRLPGRLFGLEEAEDLVSITLELPALYGPILKNYRRHLLIAEDSVLVIVDEVKAREPVGMSTRFTVAHEAKLDLNTVTLTGDHACCRIWSTPAAGASSYTSTTVESEVEGKGTYEQVVSSLDNRVEEATWLHAIICAENTKTLNATRIESPDPNDPLCFTMVRPNGSKRTYRAKHTSSHRLRWSFS